MAPFRYCSLVQVKSWVGITTNDFNTDLTSIIEGVSGLFDLLYGQSFEGTTVTGIHGPLEVHLIILENG